MNIEVIAAAEPAAIPRPVRSRRNSLTALPCGAQCTSLSKIEHADAKKMPIRTSIFDLYKIGPGPSSSHTIGPMKICNDFLESVRKELIPTLHPDLKKSEVTAAASDLNAGDCSPVSTASSSGGEGQQPRYMLRCHLHGSLSATGLGHGTHNAVIGGLLGWQPKTCDPEALLELLKDPSRTYEFPVPELGHVPISFNSIVWHDPVDSKKLHHPNTLFLEIMTKDAFVHKIAPPDPLSQPLVPGYSTIFEREYYSVGGGFIEKKGGLAEDLRFSPPTYPFSTFKEIELYVKEAKIDVLELLLRNEEVQTHISRDQIFDQIDAIIKVMDSSVENGLKAQSGFLPGPIQLRRKAGKVFESARQDPMEQLGFLNAYSMAASEENAAGMRVVTAPTSGSAGVIPGLLYFMKHHLQYSEETRRASLICGCLIGLLVKHNASISGAEMGCMGEIGVASAMGAAMLIYAKRLNKDQPIATDEDRELVLKQLEAAAEISLEHHLGLTCDPIGGFVQIPCIQRNSMGAVKAYNAAVLALASDPRDQKVSLDDIIDTVRRTGEDMNRKYKETSQGGLAVLPVARSEC